MDKEKTIRLVKNIIRITNTTPQVVSDEVINRQANQILAELEEANKKPEPSELKHGDGGLDENGEVLLIEDGKSAPSPVPLVARDESQMVCGSVINGKHETRKFTKFFNAFDDLKAIKEAMAGNSKEFSIILDCDRKMNVCSSGGGIMLTNLNKDNGECVCVTFFLSQFKDFIINCRALAAILEQENDC